MPETIPESNAPSLYDRLGGHHRIGILVRNFYRSLQQDPVVGSIFHQHVADWPAHYETLTQFWVVQTGGPARYRGRLLHAHAPLALREEHLIAWLDQWRRSCALHFDAPEAGELITLAERLAARMRSTVVR